MKLEKFKEKNRKRTGMIVFTIICMMLVSGVILYRTFAIFEVRTNQNVIKGNIQDPGNLYFAFYVDDKIEKRMPQKNEGYIFDEENSYCGVLGNKDTSISLDFDKNKWNVTVSGLKESRTKCNLKFVKGAYILGEPVKAVTSGDGLYEVPHGEEVSGTLNDDGFKETEWRYGGASPNNYVLFNNEKWRIIGLVNVMIDESNVEQRVKIVRDESIGKYAWDRSESPQWYSNDWTKSKLMEMLNNGYYNSMNNVECYSVKTDDDKVTTLTTCDFSGEGQQPKGLDEKSRNYIDENIVWNLGGESTGYISVSTMYRVERGDAVWEERPTTWSSNSNEETLFHSISLIYPSDYGYAVGGEGRTKCLASNYRIQSYNDKTCKNNDWLYQQEQTWVLTPNYLYKDNVYFIDTDGAVYPHTYANGNLAVKPTLYLKQNVQIVDNENDGSKEKPYDLIQQS